MSTFRYLFNLISPLIDSDVNPSVLKVSLSLSVKTLGMLSLRNDANRPDPWACSAHLRRNSYCVTMVCTPSMLSKCNALIYVTEFGLYVDKHGDPCRTIGTIEWEGTAERVAFHAPYILLFDSRFIEVRHVETGRLAQIIPGNEIRCTWDGRGVSTQTPAVPIDEDGNQEAQVHFVMNSTDGSGAMRTRNIVQHVCELIPTVLISAQGTNATSPSPRGPLTPSRPSDASQRSHAPALAHMSRDSYASSGSAPTSQYYASQGGAQPYAASPMSAASSAHFYPAGAAQPYTAASSPSTTHSYSSSTVPQAYPFTATPGTPYSNTVPGANSYYTNRAALPPGSAPPSAELRSTHSWRS